MSSASELPTNLFTIRQRNLVISATPNFPQAGFGGMRDEQIASGIGVLTVDLGIDDTRLVKSMRLRNIRRQASTLGMEDLRS